MLNRIVITEDRNQLSARDMQEADIIIEFTGTKHTVIKAFGDYICGPLFGCGIFPDKQVSMTVAKDLVGGLLQ